MFESYIYKFDGVTISFPGLSAHSADLNPFSSIQAPPRTEIFVRRLPASVF